MKPPTDNRKRKQDLNSGEKNSNAIFTNNGNNTCRVRSESQYLPDLDSQRQL